MRRREFVSLPLAAGAVQAAERPNVVILLADDLGSADLGCYGGEIETPNLDRLVGEGVKFDQFHSFPVCSPTRSALMAGRNPVRLGVIYSVIRPWSNYGVPVEEHFLPETFRAAGYQTAITGKWHLGHGYRKFLPNARGFDHSYGHVNGAIDYWTHVRDGGLDWHRNGKSLREEGYSTDLITAEAVRWVRERDKRKPFLLYVPFNAPHAPLEAPEELVKKYARIPDERRRTFAAMVDRMDTGVGRILRTLEEERVAANTLVLFFSDNGGPVAQGARNTPLRGAKGSVWQGGLRAPGILRFPGRAKAGTRSGQVMTVMDVFPTLAAACGVKPVNKLPFDGKNLWGAIESGKSEMRDDLFFAIERVQGVQCAARRGEWKLVREEAGGKATEQLFHLGDDPNETTDVAAKNDALRRDLRARIDHWKSLHPANGVRHEEKPPAGYKAPAEWAEAARG